MADVDWSQFKPIEPAAAPASASGVDWSQFKPVEETSYLGASARAGMHSVAAAGARIVDSLNPFTTSEEEAAVLYKNDPEAFKQFTEHSAAAVLNRFAREQTAAARGAMQAADPNEKGAVSGRALGELEYLTTDPDKAAYLSPTRMAGDLLNSLPSTVAMAVAAYITKGGARAAMAEAEAAAVARGATAAEAQVAGRQAAMAQAATTMAKTSAAGEGAVGYGQQFNQAYDEALRQPQDALAQSPQYQELLQQGYAPEMARQVLAAQVGRESGVAAGAVDAGTNLVGGQVLGRIIGEGGSLAARGARGFATESATEAVQSAGEQLGQNQAMRAVNPGQDLWAGVGEAAVQGAVVGGLMGGGTAAAFGGPQQGARAPEAAPAQPTPVDVTTPVADFRAAVDTYLGNSGPSAAELASNVLAAPDLAGAIDAAESVTDSLPVIADRKMGAALAPLMDRQAALAAQANAATTQFDRQQAMDQAAAGLQINDGTYDLAPAEAAPEVSPLQAEYQRMLDQQRLAEAAAPTPQRTALQDEHRQMLLRQTMRRIEERGGVASPQEAQTLEEAGMGRPYDRVDESLGPRSLPQAPELPAMAAPAQVTSPGGILLPEPSRARDPNRLQQVQSSVEFTPAQDFRPSTSPGAAPAAQQTVPYQAPVDTAGLSAQQAPLQQPASNAVEFRQMPDTNGLELAPREPVRPAAPALPATQQVGPETLELAPREVTPQPAVDMPQPVEQRTGDIPVQRVQEAGGGLTLVPRDQPAAVRQPLASPGSTVEFAPARAAQAPDLQLVRPEDEAGDARVQQLAEQRQAQRRATDERNVEAGALRAPAAPNVQAAIEALRVPPAQRSATDRLAISAATGVFAPEQMDLLQRAASAPATLSATDKVQLRQLQYSAQRDDGDQHAPAPVQPFQHEEARRVDAAALPDQTEAADGELSQQGYEFVRNLGRLFAKKVEVFDSDRADAPDGYVRSGDQRTIYLNRRSQMAHLVVFGHELLHQARRDNPAIYDAIVKSINLNGKADLQTPGINGDMEEFSADVLGNRFKDPEFWTGVFDQLEDRPSASRLGETIRRVIDSFRRAVGGLRGYATDKMVADLDEVKAAAQQALAEYARGQYDEAVAVDREARNDSKFEAQPTVNEEGSGAESLPEKTTPAPGGEFGARRRLAAEAARREMGERPPKAAPQDPEQQSAKRLFDDTGRDYTAEQRQAFERLGRVVEVPTLKERIQSLRQDLGKKIAQGLADQFAPIAELDKKAYNLARLSKGASGAIEALLHHGKLKIVDGVYDADQSGGVIEKLFAPLQGEGADFLWWVAGQRAEQLAAEDRENLFTPGDIAAMKSLDTGVAPFDYKLQHGPGAGRVTRDRTLIYRDAARTLDQFNRNVMDLAEQSGLIDGESRQFWEHEFYVPFYRQSEEGDFVGANLKKGLVRQQAFKALKGGTDKLNSDLLSNTLLNWSHLIDAAAKNRAAVASVQAAERLGVAEAVPAGTKKAAWVMEGGDKKYYTISDPYIMQAISSLEYAGLKGGMWDALTKFKHWLTIGVTASPAFKIRNLVRDSLQAISVSPLSLNPIGNIREGIAASDKESQTYVSALASGGLIRFGTMLEGREADRVRQLVKTGVKDSSILDSETKVRAFYDKTLEPLIAAYQELGNRSEEINRAALFQQLRKQGVSLDEAALQARDLMDFSMQGTWQWVRTLTQVVPFLNARIQGLYKLGRGAAEHPQRFAAVLGAVALASLALQAAYEDDDDWKKREDWDRDNFWWFKVGGVAWRVPKPFEIGAIATLAERGVEMFTNKDMTPKRYAKIVRDILSDNLSLNPVPQAVKPLLDIYANKDSFSGRPIETLGMEKIRPDYRFNAGTSMLARGASTAGQAAAGAIGANFLSPVQVDHLLRGYFGWLGSFVGGACDRALKPLTGQPEAPARDYWKFLTQGIAQETDGAQSYYVTALYDQAKVVEEAYGTYRSLIKSGKPGEAAEFAAEHREDIAKYKMFEKVKSGEAKLSEMIRMIQRSPSLSPDEKKERIDAIRKRQDQLARMVTSAYR